MTPRPGPARRTRSKAGIGIAVLAVAAFAAFATMGSASSVTAAQAQYAPVNTVAPTIAGTTTDGQVLTANEGTWTGQPGSFAYQWLRCDAAGNGCADIAGATGKTYKIQTADVSKTIRVRITAANNDGKTTVTSGATGAVASSGPAGAIKLPNGETSVPASSVSLAAGQRLVITDVQFTPNPVKVFSHGPISVRVKVKDNRGYVVRDVLVFVRSTPEVTSTPPEQVTQQDGWVTLTTVPQADFPKNPAYSVQMFVRARKSGEDPLGGVSTRRLVQFSLSR
jgi:hypothetical protein